MTTAQGREGTRTEGGKTLRIVVCVKQVPETTESAKINPETGTLMREGVASITNPFDMYALEEALRIKEKQEGDHEVVALSMGPPQAQEMLKEALALGCDRAVLLSDRAFAGADTLATAYTLARAIETLGGCDLVLCGKQAVDGDTAQVGPGVAEELDIPHATYVRKIASLSPQAIEVERLVEGGIEQVEMTMPALLTVVKEINEPRLPSLRGIMKAKRMEVTVWDAAELAVDAERVGLAGSPTEVVKVFTPQLEKDTQILEGSPDEQAKQLIHGLRQAGLM